MGSKGNIEKGGHRRDYDMVTWLDTTNFIFIDQIIFIEKESGIVLSPSLKLKLRDEINQYNSMVQMQNIAPHKGGSGRVNDFFASHIRALIKIFEDAGGKVTLGRKNPSRKHPNGFAKSPFLDFCYAVNDRLPSEMQRVKALDNNPNQGFTRAIRRVLNKDYV